MRFAYLYFMSDAPELVPKVAPQHAAYWHERALPGYLGGPFGDRSGGLITFEADSLAAAEGLAASDPFRHEGLIERHWLKEWDCRRE